MMGITFNALFVSLVVLINIICDKRVDASNNKKVPDWENVFNTNFTTSLQLQHFGNKTYYLGTYMKASFLQAMQICQSVHMNLVTVESIEENDRLYKYIKETNKGDEFWSSGSRLLDGKHWKWMSTGKSVHFTKWATGQPDSQLEHCLLLVHQKNTGVFWHDKDCNSQFWFICERRDDETGPGSNNVAAWDNLFVDPVVWSNLIRFENKSYYFSRHFKGTFLQASQFCEMIGMNSLTIRSEAENSKLHKYIRDTNAATDWWCSGTRIIDGKSWIWSPSGEQVDYTNWLIGQPDNLNHLCLQLTDQKNNGLFWNDQDCNFQYPVICDKWHNAGKSETMDDIEKLIDVRLGDSDNTNHKDLGWLIGLRKTSPGYIEYEHIEGRKFYIHSGIRVSQNEAAQFCEYHKMQLLSIENEEENNLIERLLAKSSVIGPYWTSGRKSGGVWMWQSTGETLSFFNFNNILLEYKTSCIDIDDQGKWNRMDCDHEMKFICEEPRVVPQNQCSVQPVVNVYVRNEVVTAAEKKVSDTYTRYENVTIE